MAKQKSRKEKLEEYELKYANIPRDYDSRLAWLIDQFKLTPNRMDEIIEKKRNMETNLQYYDFKVILYEDPEGAKRPRFRLVNRKNFMNVAMQASNFVHVYSPNAAEDHKYMHRLIDEELGLDDYDYDDYEIDMRNRLNEYREQRKIDFQYDLALLEIEYNLKRDLEKYKYELSKNR